MLFNIFSCQSSSILDSAAVSISVVILVELTNTVFGNSTNITTNIETAMLLLGLVFLCVFFFILDYNSMCSEMDFTPEKLFSSNYKNSQLLLTAAAALSQNG